MATAGRGEQGSRADWRTEEASWEEFTRRSAPSTTKALLTIQSGGNFGLNLVSYELLGQPERVVLLFDRKRQRLGLRKADDTVPHSYPVKPQSANTSFVVVGKAFTGHYGIERGHPRRYIGELEDDILAFDLTQDPLPAVARRKGRRDEPVTTT